MKVGGTGENRLVPFGSSGDVHPFVGLGLEAEIARPPCHVPLASRNSSRCSGSTNLTWLNSGILRLTHGLCETLGSWHPTRALNVITESIVEGLRPVYQALEELYEKGETLVIGDSRHGRSNWQEVLGIPLATVHLSPSIFRSVHDTPMHGPRGCLDGGQSSRSGAFIV